MPVTKDNVGEVCTYHTPTPEQVVHYTEIRAAAKAFMETLLEHTPPCADQQAALRLAREAVMTANAAVALNGMV